MKSWTEYTKTELLKLPQRAWCVSSIYDTVLFVNTRTKHDSGYNYFAIIGCHKDTPIEIAANMDDFYFNSILNGEEGLKHIHFAFDCSMKGVFRLHSPTHRIEIEESLSSTQFKFIKRKS